MPVVALYCSDFSVPSCGQYQPFRALQPQYHSDFPTANLPFPQVPPKNIMTLITLPAEILFTIFDHIGANYFREDPKHLLICKRWYSFAQLTLVKTLRLDARMLEIFTRDNGSSRALLAQHAQEISINFKKRTLHDTKTQNPRKPTKTSLRRKLSTKLSKLVRNPLTHRTYSCNLYDPISERNIYPHEWIEILQPRLRCLVDVLPTVTGLKRFTFETSRYLVCVDWHLSIVDMIESFPNTLTSLDLSIKGQFSSGHRNRSDEAYLHVCPLIPRRLVNLRSLRYDMPSVCEQVFCFSSESQIEEMTVSLGWGTYLNHCSKSVRESHCELGDLFLEAAKNAIPNLPKLTAMTLVLEQSCIVASHGSVCFVNINCITEERVCFREKEKVWFRGREMDMGVVFGQWEAERHATCLQGNVRIREMKVLQ